MIRGIERRRIFKDDEDRDNLLDRPSAGWRVSSDSR
jgi:hypothetical protein